MAEHAQPMQRERAFKRYFAGQIRAGKQPLSYKEFCPVFDMGYKAGRKVERRRNFGYLIKTKYGGSK